MILEVRRLPGLLSSFAVSLQWVEVGGILDLWVPATSRCGRPPGRNRYQYASITFWYPKGLRTPTFFGITCRNAEVYCPDPLDLLSVIWLQCWRWLILWIGNGWGNSANVCTFLKNLFYMLRVARGGGCCDVFWAPFLQMGERPRL